MSLSTRGLCTILLACAYCIDAVSAKNALLDDKGPPPPTLEFKPLTSSPVCLPCENFFARLEVDTSLPSDRNMVQRIEVIERGAPKSGTGGMFEWAIGSLYHACQYLNQHYGRESCFVEWGKWGPGDYFGNHTLIFEPPVEQPSDTPCPCTGVHRVTINFRKTGKHQLPVEDDCPFFHYVGFHLNPTFCQESDAGEKPAAKLGEVSRCMQEAQCRVDDDRLQMVVFRDPRPAAVSSFYHLRGAKNLPLGMDIDSFVVQNFPGFCKWLLIRLVLFMRTMPKEKVAFFWYNEWQVDAVQWHRHLFQVVGLRFPEHVLAAAAEAALADDFLFFTKGRDSHAGGAIRPTDHTYRDEISEDTGRFIDKTMRQWLPIEFLSRLNAL